MPLTRFRRSLCALWIASAMKTLPIYKVEGRTKMEETIQKSQSLGSVPLPSETFEHDLSVSDKYQSFSAELLRLALLGVGAIGFLISNFVLQREAATNLKSSSGLKPYLVLSLISLGISAACALLHRYFGPDSLACHLEALRLMLRNNAGDRKNAEKQEEARDRRFKFCARILFASATFLWVGAVFLIASLVIAI